MSLKRSSEAMAPCTPLTSSSRSKRQRQRGPRIPLPITSPHPPPPVAVADTAIASSAHVSPTAGVISSSSPPSSSSSSRAASRPADPEDGPGFLTSWQTRHRTVHDSLLLPLHFLLQAAHTAAFSPAVSRQCCRQLRRLAAESSVVLDAAVQARFCSRCDAVLVPGISCSLKKRLDSGRTERWRRRQIKKRRQWEKKKQKRREKMDAQDSQHEADAAQQQQQHQQPEVSSVAAAATPAAAVRGQAVGKQRQRRAERRTAESQRRRQQQEAALQAVRFYQTVNVCSACGHQNALVGTEAKKGGRHADDVRDRAGREAGVRKRRRQQMRTDGEEEAKPRTSAGEKAAELSEQKRKKLRRQQSQSRAEKQGPQAAGALSLTAAPEPFTGSLFFRFQRQGKRGDTEMSTAAAAAAPSSAAAAATPTTPSPSPRQPFAFSHPSSAGPSSTARPSLLEQIAKQQKEQRRAQSQSQQSGGSSSSSLYSLLQSFNQ